MKIFELAEMLKAVYDLHGNIDVHFAGPNHDQEPYNVGRVTVQLVEEDDYPEDYNMPAGYTFVQLEH